MNQNPLVYLACAYTHDDPEIRAWRWREISRIAGELFKRGIKTVVPISQSHPMEIYADIKDTRWAHWWELDVDILRRSDELWIAVFDGWDKSVGVRGEVIIAQALGLPIKLIFSNLVIQIAKEKELKDLIGTWTMQDGQDLRRLKKMGGKR